MIIASAKKYLTNIGENDQLVGHLNIAKNG